MHDRNQRIKNSGLTNFPNPPSVRRQIKGEGGMRVLLAGASGYIGHEVLIELVRRKISVVAPVRRIDFFSTYLREQASIIRSDILEDPGWDKHIGAIDAVISCLASRTGSPSDARKVDYEANVRLLESAQKCGAEKFILLSAICVQKPRLAFQYEKLRFERKLIDSSIRAAIVRPTAFFKSLAGQIDRVKEGKPFLLFGSGKLTACKPISSRDLAIFLVNQLNQSNQNVVLPIGGPGPAITSLDQAKLLCELADVPLKTRGVPPQIFDVLRWLLLPLTIISKRMADRAEFLRIAKYYATESMLLWDKDALEYDAKATPEFGVDTLEAFYRRVLFGEESVPGREANTLF